MQKIQQKIVLIGGPGTGKTSVLNSLKEKGYYCYDEISREVTLQAQKKGIEQLFLTKPLLFSQMLLEGREMQFLEATKQNKGIVFFDRGIPDVYAYLNFFKTKYPALFIEKSKEYKYDYVFHFAPWKEIYTTDNERYENFETATIIDTYLIEAYNKLGYTIVTVPFGSVDDRANFIINSLSCGL